MLLTYLTKKRNKVSYEKPKTLRIQSTIQPKEKRNFNEWASVLDNRMRESVYNYCQTTNQLVYLFYGISINNT